MTDFYTDPATRTIFDKSSGELAEDQLAFVEDVKKFKRTADDNIIVLDSAGGFGKRLPLHYPVLTPNGFVRNDSLKVGDFVIGLDGCPTKITAVYDSEDLLNFYQISFADGTVIDCCEDHQWLVDDVHTSKSMQTWSTKDLFATIKERKSPKQTRRFAIPLVQPVQFPEKDLLIDPYLLGFLIGDGCFTDPRKNQLNVAHLLSDSEEIKNLLDFGQSEPSLYVCDPNGKSPNTARWVYKKDLFNKIAALGLWGIKSGQKYIPSEYKLGSIDQRLSILQGLMDSDGSVAYLSSTRVKYMFDTTSALLRDDVVFLVKSLGGSVRCTSSTRPSKNTEYMLSIRLNLPMFRLTRKRIKQEQHTSTFRMVNKIISIKPINPQLGRCITVETPDHCYVIKDFVITHNTYAVKEAIKDFSNVILTGTTDNAVSVLEQSIENYECKTIHSTLSFRPYVGDDGEQFLGRSGNQPSIEDGTCIVVDEASMLPRIIHKDIRELYSNLYFILLLDSNQLPPVGEPRFDVQKEFKYHSKLWIPKRYANWDIFDMSQDVIKKGFKADLDYYNNNRFMREYLEMLSAGEEVVFTAYHHHVVDKMTDLVRQTLYGTSLGDLPVKNEKIRLKTIRREGIKCVSNGTICTVMDIDSRYLTVKLPDGRAEMFDLDYDNKVQQAFDAAKKKHDKKLWEIYYDLLLFYPRISSPYTSTVHGLQGRSISKVFVDVEDLKKFSDKSILYTAITRAVDNVFFR